MASEPASTQLSQNLFMLKTVQATVMKVMVDSLKDVLVDVNLVVDPTGLKIVALDNSHSILVHMKLNAEQFEVFECEKKMYVGLNMLKFHMLVKTIGNNDVLSLYIERNDPNKLGITIENPEKNVKTNYKLSILDLDVVNIDIPDADFQTTITMPSVNFQKIVRDMHNIADNIEIRNVDNMICFSCRGDFCTQETILGTEKSSGLSISKNPNSDSHEIIQGVFSLKYLSMFTKFTNLCNVVELHLKNNFPLILQYRVASLGMIRIIQAQQD
jgi:proliferating cell nuclear antigen